MTGEKLDGVLHRVASSFEKSSYGDVNGVHVPRLAVGFREDWTIDHGETKDTFYVQRCQIGTKELVEALDKEVSDETVARSVLTLMHEVCGHSRQVNHEFNRDMPLCTVLALNHHTCRHSPLYYGLDEHGNPTQAYFRQPHEIAAQYMGIKCTYEFLCGLWDDEARAEAAVAAVHNNLITKDSAYIQKPFGGSVPYREKVSEILDDLDGSFKKNVFEKRDYPKDGRGRVARDDGKVKRPDIVDDFVDNGGSRRIYWQLRFSANGLKTDWIMASLRSQIVDKNGIMRQQAALRGIPLSVKYAMAPMRPPVGSRPKKDELLLDNLDSPEDMHGKGSKEQKRLVARPGAPPDRYGQAVGVLGDVAMGDEDRALDGQGTQLGDD